MTDREYRFGEPNKHGEFPYVYANGMSKEDFRSLLLERLPESYDMQLVDPIELEIVRDITNAGIDPNLEACTMTREAKIVDRTLSDGTVMQRHCDIGYDPNGMLCLLKRLSNFVPSDALIEFAEEHFDDDDVADCYGETFEERASSKLFNHASQLFSLICETLQIERDEM